ncbi:serine hydrolase domain-containing protein [Nibrella saemangeumensis]|uniref:Serine hydrolase domain-containing protein n=1 Tax=Nibrella saemangeumensis TaxID=1084526 RepID=A0ABP8NBF4_9BACT
MKTLSTHNEVSARHLRGLIKASALFLTIVLLSALSATGYTQPLDKAKLDQFFDRLADRNKAMGSLTIAKDGTILYTRAIGYSHINGTAKKPLTSATRFRVGSVTKMFTAAMILQLVEEGKMKLTDTLNSFFPQIPNANRITIAHILAHRSGIQDVMNIPAFRASRFRPISKNELLAIIAKSTPDFAPDERYAYSNSGYVVLGMIVEKVTGKSYELALQERITSRIGLKDTYPGTGPIDLDRDESFSYKYGRDWEQQPETHISLLFGSGFLISTPNDLASFIRALFDGKIITQESLSQMKQNKFAMEPFTYNGKTFYGHTGGIDNFGSWLVYLPEEKLAVAYATNAKVYPVSNIMDGIFDIYYNKPFTIPTFESIRISPEVLEQYVGVYSSPGAPVKFTVTRDDTRLFVQMTGQSAIPLEPTTQDTFKIESAGIVITFDAAQSQMRLLRNGRERVLTKEN